MAFHQRHNEHRVKRYMRTCCSSTVGSGRERKKAPHRFFMYEGKLQEEATIPLIPLK